jgi:hypothetical protein
VSDKEEAEKEKAKVEPDVDGRKDAGSKDKLILDSEDHDKDSVPGYDPTKLPEPINPVSSLIENDANQDRTLTDADSESEQGRMHKRITDSKVS